MRLLFSNEWFDAVSSEGQYESEFESIIRSRASSLFPQFHVVPFRIAVESEEGTRIPDLALVDYAYRSWWVVEVEMAHHSLYRHVMPQVEVFARGKYGERHASQLARGCGELDAAALQDMILGAQPRVLVVVNRGVPEWIAPIHGLGGIVTVVEVFRSERNEHILRINGDYPEHEDAEIASICRLDNRLPNLLRVDSPASLGIAHGEEVAIEYNEGLTSWSRLDSADEVWLVPSGRNPLAAKQEYLIMKDAACRLTFKTREEIARYHRGGSW